ncbi:hypothetical protein LCGC14_1573510 [marine sediment metagenome]|uniref:Uncharacterized protein n=1 Tax=marine sediment metagenome TaxID=412755 RepID=A0A0F9IJ32_9ZZZZ
MSYNMKKVEIVITDGYSTDNLMEVIQRHYKTFFQIKFAHSDHSVLPFTIVSNNPACDRNAMVANLPTFEKIIMTDPEVLFIDKNELTYISNKLNDKETIIWYTAFKLKETWRGIHWNYGPLENFASAIDKTINGANGFVNCINRSLFLETRGYDERFTLGFAAEDCQWIHWHERNKRSVKAPGKVVHLYHLDANHDDRYREIYDNYTIPLYRQMLKDNVQANSNCPEWKRPEMIKDIQVFKEEN